MSIDVLSNSKVLNTEIFNLVGGVQVLPPTQIATVREFS